MQPVENRLVKPESESVLELSMVEPVQPPPCATWMAN